MHQGSGDVAPFLHAEMFANSVDAQRSVITHDDSLRLSAAQDFDHVRDAIPLAPLREPRDTGQELLRFGGSINRRARLEAVVAGVAPIAKDLPEVPQLHRTPTFCGFRVVQHLS
jgi:hypothetical protein